MNKIKQILRYYAHGMGLKSISSVLSVSRNTVRRYGRIDGGDTAECPHRTEYAKAYYASCFGHGM